MMRRRRLRLLAALGVVIAFAACTLNPQPLPPLDPDPSATPGSDASFGSADSGSRQDENTADGAAAGPRDGSPPPNDETDGGDAGDAGDADAGDGGDAEAD